MNHETMPAQGPVDVNVMHDKGNLTIENHPTCPECGSADTEVVAANCMCHRTYDGPTCWRKPVCNACGKQGYANSEGIYWYA